MIDVITVMRTRVQNYKCNEVENAFPISTYWSQLWLQISTLSDLDSYTFGEIAVVSLEFWVKNAYCGGFGGQ